MAEDRDQKDDTEGQKRIIEPEESDKPDDTEGQRVRKLDEDDTEGHRKA